MYIYREQANFIRCVFIDYQTRTNQSIDRVVVELYNYVVCVNMEGLLIKQSRIDLEWEILCCTKIWPKVGINSIC